MNQEQELNQIAITSPDGREARLAELRRLFPDLFDGEGALDEKALRQLVADEVGHIKERFRFEWAGKAQSKRFAFAPSKATLVYDPERSVNADGTPSKSGETLADNTSQNLLIEGDNLEVLKLLQASYFGKVKCIYIDPPYNTGNDFIYPDDYSQSVQDYWESDGTKKEGVRLKAVTDSSGRRHSEWLNFMQSRLLLGRQFLRDDGIVFVSIGDDELHNLRRLMDEVFGEDNFISVISRPTGTRMGSGSRGVGKELDYILIYSKNLGQVNALPMNEKELALYNEEDSKGRYLLRSLRRTGGENRREDRPTMFFPVEAPDGSKVLPLAPEGWESRWSCGPETYEELVKNDDIVWKQQDGTWKVYQKFYLKGSTKEMSDLWSGIEGNKKATREANQIFDGDKVFDHPKPVDLMRRVVLAGGGKDDIYMDFFAGSGATGHGVLAQNEADGGTRKFILVQIPEIIEKGSVAYTKGFRKISDITIERCKRVGAQLRDNNPMFSGDTGFRVLELAKSHFPSNTFAPDPDKTEEENIKALEDHLKAAAQLRLFEEDEFNGVVTEIALKNGFGLFYTLERLHDFTSNAVYILTGNDKEALLCLDAHLDGATIVALTAFGEQQLIVLKAALDTTRKFELQTAFKDNLWVV